MQTVQIQIIRSRKYQRWYEFFYKLPQLAAVAVTPIIKDTVLAKIDGDFFDKTHPAWSSYQFNHMVQVGPSRWRLPSLLGAAFNHSCNPNAGIRGLYEFVAMRDIAAGEEICWDYAMSENYEWRMDCLCGTPQCRKVVGAHDLLPPELKLKYKGYISDWLSK